jgi:hypothetical protein
VGAQLSVDACASTFFLSDARVLDSLRCIISGRGVSDKRSLSALGRELCDPMLELPRVCSEIDRFDLNVMDLSSLSVDAVDWILSGSSFYIESEDELLRRLLRLGSEYRPLLRHVEMRLLSCENIVAFIDYFEFPPEFVWRGIAHRLLAVFAPGFGSVIISSFPEIFAEFREKRFSLLWRGSRDGFGGRDFHNRCDGQANTLTLIEDTKGNIFGGFTPVKWESPVWNTKEEKEDNRCKRDSSLQSFLFTLKNPHNFPARKFHLKAEKQGEAIYCDFRNGPCFGRACDIGVLDSCNTAARSYTFFGCAYANDTGMDALNTFFTGAHWFQVKEIEVFKISG